MAGYREIADALREAIEHGEYRPGDVLPTLEEIQSQWGVGKETARRAIAVLRTEGLVVPIRRRGTVVRDRQPVRLPLERHRDVATTPGALGPWESACAAQGLPGSTEVKEVQQTPAKGLVAILLEVPTGTLAVRRLQHMLIDAQVTQIQETWLLLSLAGGTPLAQDQKLIGGIYRALVSIGYPPANVTETVTSRMPTREEAQVLQLDLGSPVLAIDRITRSQDGTVLALSRAVAVGDRVQLVYNQALDVAAP